MTAARVSGALATIALALFVLAPARADDAAEARFFDDLGRRAYARGRFEDALAAFLDAQVAAPSARNLYNVALAAELAHHDALAFSSFETYLDESDDPDRHRVADARARHDRLARTLALVHVASEPSGAELWVDRRELGSFGRTPRTLVLDPGAHRIEIVSPDHEPAIIDVTATRGTREERNATLTVHVGTIRVDAIPAGAVVRATRGGETRELVTAAAETLPVGRWTLTATADGHVAETVDVAITRGGSERRTLTLRALPPPVGRLVVSSGGVHARVAIDGVARAETPARLDGIPTGTHRVSLEASGYVPWEGELEIREEHATRLSVTLVPR